jgi:hypothetical protein
MYARARGFGGGTFYFNGFGFTFRTHMRPEEIRKERQEQEAAEAAWRKHMVDEVRRRREAEEVQEKARTAAKAAEEKARALAKEQLEKAEKVKQEALWAREKATT